jgi:methylenetetrahydrofolate dehydrogenase (NADP+)/methenyltetrahydrofolate cyclohydrolase
MTAKLIKGTEIREEILNEIEEDVKKIKEEHGQVPGLVTILVGENPASISYVTLKVKTANRLGFKEIQENQPEDISEEALLALIDKYNNDDSIHGILVQLPLPKQIDEKKILNAIDPDKDVDGFHPVNVGRLMIGGAEVRFPPCDASEGRWRQFYGDRDSHTHKGYGLSLQACGYTDCGRGRARSCKAGMDQTGRMRY